MLKLKGLIDEDFTQYKMPSMFVIFPFCTFKCDRDCGRTVCQNSALANSPIIEISEISLVQRYLDNKITRAIVFGGLEPFDTYDSVISLISEFRKFTDDDIVIYSGYTEEELESKLGELQNFKNIIVKFGRFRPMYPQYYRDEVLGVDLASDNQYAKKISGGFVCQT